MAKTILLADDSVTIQKVVGITFASEDVELVTVDNGDDALTRAREVRPDLVLADISMPGLNGYELCEAIKTDANLTNTPVVLLTGTFESYDAERTTKAGADAHIAKPFEAQALVDLAHSLLSRPAATETPQPAMELVRESAAHTVEPELAAPEFLSAPEPAPRAAPEPPSFATPEPLATPEPMPETSPEDLSFADLEFTRDIPPPPQRVSGSDATVMMGSVPTLDPDALPDAPAVDPLAGEPLAPAAPIVEEPRSEEPLRADADAVPNLEAPDPVQEDASEDAYGKTSLIDPHAAQALLNSPSTLDPSDADTFHGHDEHAASASEDWAYGPHRSAATPPPVAAPIVDRPPPIEEPLIEEPLPDEALPSEPIAPEPVYEARLPEVPLAERAEVDAPSIPEVPILETPEIDAAPLEATPIEDEPLDAAPLEEIEPLAEPAPLRAEPEPFIAEPEPLMPEPLALTPEPEAPVHTPEPIIHEREEVSDVFGDRTGPGVLLRPAEEDTTPDLEETDGTTTAAPIHVDPSAVRESIEKVAWEAFGPLSEQLVREVVKKVEEVCWDIVPELAERLVKEEIQRLTRDED